MTKLRTTRIFFSIFQLRRILKKNCFSFLSVVMAISSPIVVYLKNLTARSRTAYTLSSVFAQYGGRSSVVERLVVVQDVVGSIPIGRPTFSNFSGIAGCSRF